MSASNVPNTTNLPPIWNVSNWTSSSGTQGPAGPEGATGSTYQFTDKIFLGSSAGTGQGSGSIAIGFESGTNQDINAIAIGRYAGDGSSGQSPYAIAIGTGAGRNNQQPNSICIGNESGTFSAGENSIGIGSFCGGTTGISSSSIVLNASGNFFSSGTTGFFVNPIRGNQGNTYVLGFNDSTNEITYENASSSSGASEEQLTIFSKMGRVLKDFDTKGSTASITLPFVVGGPNDLISPIGISGTGKYVGMVDNSTLFIWISQDYGLTWTDNTFGGLAVYTPTFSESGQYVFGTHGSNQGIYISSDYGSSFTSIPSILALEGRVAMSCNGKLMYCAGYDSFFFFNPVIWYSTDYGATWNTKPAPETSFQMTCDATGKYLLLLTLSLSVYASNDYADSWTIVGTNNCNALCSISASGQYQSYYGTDLTTIYISNDFGNTWTPQTVGVGIFPPRFSETGQYGIVSQFLGTNTGGDLYVTEDYGYSWSVANSSFTSTTCAITKSGESFYCATININTLHTYNYT